MGTSKVYTSQAHSQTSDYAVKDRVIGSILLQPVDLDYRLPDSYLDTENTQHISRKCKFRRAISCSSEASHTRKATRPFDILDWLSGVHVIFTVCTENGSYAASGTVIASRYVLTSASSVFSREINKEVDKRDIKILSKNDRVDTNLKIEVIEIYYSKKYAINGEEDFALLLLDKDIGAFSGSIGLKASEEEEVLGKPIYLCGYKTIEENQDKYQIRREEDLKLNIFEGLIDCSISIQNLLIGSIFYYQESSKYYVIGLLTSSANSETFKALHLNSTRIKKIESWIRKCSIKHSIITSLDLSLFPYSTPNLLFRFGTSGALDLLVSLDLSRNSLGPNGIKSIYKLSFKSLRSLNLERNDIGCRGDREIARGKFGKLTHLKLGGNKISFKGAKYLAFGKLNNLIELDLQDNRIGDDGTISISRGSFTSLTMLNLSRNGLGPLAAKGLATGNLLNLISLNLACNQIGNVGALILAKGNTAKLHILDVSSNGIGIEGAAALSYGKLLELNELILEANNIRERTAARLSTKYTRSRSFGVTQGCSIQDNRDYSVSYNGSIS